MICIARILGAPLTVPTGNDTRSASNDDMPSSLQSRLPAGSALTPQTAGTYYLAVSSFNNDPVSGGGQIFPIDTAFDSVVGPTGPGGDQRISGWTNEGGSKGAYTIRLTGAHVCGGSAS